MTITDRATPGEPDQDGPTTGVPGSDLFSLVATQVARTPDAVAVSFGDRQLTYAAVHRRAAALARLLRQAGPGREARVGVCLERSPELVVSLLAVAMTGGVYVPLDPGYPARRLSFMVSDSQIGTLIVDRAGAAAIPGTGARRIRVDDLPAAARHDDDVREPQPGPRSPDELAYVIYTSGSTGTPKGTLLTHRGLAPLRTAQIDQLGAGPGERVLQFASMSFDASLFEIMMALGSGATLCMSTRERLSPGQNLVAVLDEQAVTLATLPPSALAVTEPGPLPALRTVTVAGEACPPDVVARWAPGRAFFNLYGPTEATVWSTATRCHPGEPVTIGRAVAATGTYVLDAAMRPVPPGAVGELYLDGPGLARGYWNRPATTAERFLPHPFGAEPGARLYRTGDRVSVTPAGDLVFHGRADDQLKLRGYRIEPAEIRDTLLRHPAVREAAVVPHNDDAGNGHLVAYVTTRADISGPALRAHCAAELPHHLVPTKFVVLDRFPTTANGKLDRSALPKPGRSRAGQSYVAPATPTEQRLAEVWSELLHESDIGRHDNFLQLGGHSLLVTAMQNRCRGVFGVELPARTVFQSADLAVLAGQVEQRMRDASPAVVPAGSEGEDLPLSFTQSQLWFLENLTPGTAAYTTHVALGLSGAVDLPRLRAGIDTILGRHDALRTTIATHEGRPSQLLHDPAPAELPVIDLSGLPAEPRARLRAELARRVVTTPFDLARGPLFRAVVLRCGPGDHVLLLVGHHIVFDGWAFRLFCDELGACYGGVPRSALPPINARYAQFARWQRDWAASPAAAEGLAYWRDHLADAPTLLELPADRPRPPVQRFRGATRPFTVPRDVAASLPAIARDERVTVFMTLLAAYAVLLARHTDQPEVVIGTPVANRNRQEFEGVIGYFANTLALRVRVERGMTFRDVLRQVRRVCLDAYAHQEVPFELVVNEVRPERDLSHNPIFQTLFAFQNIGLGEVRLPGLETSLLEIDTGASRFDLSVAVTEGPDGLRGAVEYDTDLFDDITAVRFAGRYVSVLRALTDDLSAPADRLPMLTAEERDLLAAWNATDLPGGAPDTCLHGFFEGRADRTPDATALVHDDRHLTYGALNARANRLARLLRNRGVRAETPVGVLLERSAAVLVAMFAILKAGGAYVPLDPAYPADRLNFMINDSGIATLITETGTPVDGVPPVPVTILLDQVDTELRALPADDLPDRAGPDNLAYIIYTSGSSGRPKGVQMTHRGLPNLVATEAAVVLPSRSSRVLQVASFSFDASLWDVVMSLCFGGTLCVASSEQRLPGPALTTLMNEQAVTHATLAPSALAALPADAARNLAVLTSTGEAVTGDVVDRWAPGRRFLNGYGPTESTVGATIGQCLAGAAPPHLGRPFANTRVHLLDRALLPVPVGVPGELYIGGPGLSRGYLNRPGLTAERFVPDPYGGSGARLYRTGDRARFLADGTLVFLGRWDHQVQLRGFRVELGEIENVLRQHPEVVQAVVTTHTDQRVTRMTAYTTGAATTEQLRRFCRRHLPEHMVPGSFVTLDEFPLTSNGKIDRGALPRPVSTASEGADGVPRNATERALATIWADLLRVPQVGRHDNFFALGGDSILSIQAVARASQAGLRLTPKALFQHPTIAELASTVTVDSGAGADQGPVTGPLPATPIQNWFRGLELPNPHHFNQSLLLEPVRALDTDALAQALRAVVAHHDGLRQRLALDGTITIVPPEPDRTLLTVVDLRTDPGRLHAHIHELQTSLDLQHGPTVAALYATLGPTEHRLFVTAHHLTVDGVSWRILLDDLATAYHGRQLPPKTTSYQAWAHHLDDHRVDPERVAYWTDLLTGVSGAIPHDRPGGANLYRTADTITSTLSARQSHAVTHHGTPAQTLLLTALADALGGWTGRPRLLVDIENHGRHPFDDAIALTRTVGWFTTIQPIVLGASGVVSTHGDLDGVEYGLLRHGSASAPLAGLPTPEVCFNYLGEFDSGLDGDSPWTLVPELPDDLQDGAQQRPYPLEVTAVIMRGRLQIRWTYSTALHERATIAALAERFTARLLAEAPTDGPATDDVTEVYDLTPLQAGMHFHSLLAPASGVYVVQLSLLLQGRLDPALLRLAWTRVVARHAVLRSSFHRGDGAEPVQLVHRSVPVPWVETDWRHLSDPERQDALTGLTREQRGAGFPPDQPPLFRFALARLTDDTYRFVWTHHHLLLDGWSLPTVLGEVFQLYRGLRAGTPARLPVVRPFRDYVAWLARQDVGAAGTAWRAALAGFTAPTPVPAPSGPTEPGDDQSEIRLSPEVSARVSAVGRRLGVTVGTVVQFAWAVLLGRCAGVSDVVFGVTVAGRPVELAGVDRMVGLFINTLPARVVVDADVSVAEGLRRAQEWFVGVREFEYAPLVQVQGWSEVPRGVPLFDTLVVIENYPSSDRIIGPDAGVTLLEADATEQTEAALTLVATPGATLSLRLLSAPGRYGRADRLALLGQVSVLLEQMSTDAEVTVGRLSLLSPTQEHALIQAWNPTPTPTTGEQVGARPLIDRFLTTARTHPDRIALIDGDRQTTYGHLHTHATHLATTLTRHCHVQPDDLVALLLPRHTIHITAILATHLAGAAYLPMDPDYPPTRLHHLLTDSHATVLLTTTDILTQHPDLPTPTHTHTLDTLDTPHPHHTPNTDTDTDTGAAPNLDPDTLAYVIYTSGSTGTPKGVTITHRQAARLFDTTHHLYQPGPHDTWTLFHSLAFDFSVWELWGALTHGARLVLVDHDTRHNPTNLAHLIDQHTITILNQTPSAFLPLTHTLTHTHHLRHIIFGGENLPTHHLTTWHHHHGLTHPTLTNMYGITETTIHATHHTLTPTDLTTTTSNIGHPLNDLRIHLLDPHLHPTPTGQPGEIHLAGAGLARGYLHQPTLTATRFIPNPYGPPGDRLYRTGDRARTNPDGTLTYLGRTDHQIQLRGHRIEPAEIQHILHQHPHIHHTIITTREDHPNDHRLTAYYTTHQPHPDHTTLTHQLRTLCHTHLPPHMHPAHYIHLTHLPLTPHGKIDTHQLPPPTTTHTTPTTHTGTHAVLGAIWQRLLRVSQPVDGHDNFFRLGGHSLIATRLQLMIRAELGVEVPLRALFDAPDLDAMVAEIEARRGRDAAPRHVRPVPRRTGGDPLSSAQQRLWFLEQWQPNTPLYHMAGAVRLRGPLSHRALRTALRRVVARHDSLRTGFVVAGREPRQIVRPRWPVALPVLDVTALAAADRDALVARLLRTVADTPFDLAAAPMWRVVLLRLGPDDHQLVLCMHHLVSDGRSLELFFGELAEGYDAAQRGTAPPAPAPAVQYADYAVWEQDRIARLDPRRLHYWTDRLDGLDRVVLPTDRPRTVGGGAASALHELDLPAHVAKGVTALAEQVNATPFMVLLAAGAATLAQRFGLTDAAVGTPVDLRRSAELTDVVGCFVNTVVLRVGVRPDDTFGGLLARTRETCLDAYAHAEVPFERVVQEVQPRRDATTMPLFQVWFVVGDEPVAPDAFSGLRATTLGVAPPVARYDLRLEFRRAAASLRLVCEYKRDLFHDPTITALTRHLGAVLDAVVTDPDLPLAVIAERAAATEDRISAAVAADAESYSATSLRRSRRRRGDA